MSMYFTVVGLLKTDAMNKAAIISCCVVVAIMIITGIGITVPYLFNLWKTRTHSYYHFLLAAAEDVRNTKEEK